MTAPETPLAIHTSNLQFDRVAALGIKERPTVCRENQHLIPLSIRVSPLHLNLLYDIIFI